MSGRAGHRGSRSHRRPPGRPRPRHIVIGMSTATPPDITIVGGGNIGAALLTGLVESGRYGSLAVVEVMEERRRHLTASYPGVQVAASIDELGSCDGVVIAVKPADAPGAAAAAGRVGARRLVSIAAGVRLATLADPTVAVLRAMPNTPAIVGLGASALSAADGASDDDVAWATSVLSAVGTVDVVGEAALDAFTGAIGSGPAYVFLVAEALIDAAVGEGLSRATAERAVQQLLTGSAALLAHRGDPARLRSEVTSPGGTTAAGVRALEAHAVRAAFADAVRAATERSRELG